MLFIPFFRSAYIGAISCSAAELTELKSDNYSVWITAVDIVISIGVWAWYITHMVWVSILLAMALALRVLLVIVSNYYLFKLHSKHPGIWAIFSVLPLVLFVKSLKLQSYADEAWEESLKC